MKRIFNELPRSGSRLSVVVRYLDRPELIDRIKMACELAEGLNANHDQLSFMLDKTDSNMLEEVHQKMRVSID